jgi:hypothetical protein
VLPITNAFISFQFLRLPAHAHPPIRHAKSSIFFFYLPNDRIMRMDLTSSAAAVNPRYLVSYRRAARTHPRNPLWFVGIIETVNTTKVVIRVDRGIATSAVENLGRGYVFCAARHTFNFDEKDTNVEDRISMSSP